MERSERDQRDGSQDNPLRRTPEGIRGARPFTTATGREKRGPVNPDRRPFEIEAQS